MILKVSMVLAFFGAMIGVGLWCRRSASDVDGFVLGGRSVGPWLTAFAYGTSYFSAVVFVGYAGQFGWRYGISATWVGLGNAFLGSLLPWAVLGRRTRIMTQHLASATMPEFFGKRFDSDALKIAASAICFVFLVPYTASLYNGLSRLFAMAFDVDLSVCMILMAALTGVYVVVGGYMATAINDFIQGIVMIFGIVAVIVAVLHGQGGLSEALIAVANVSDPAAATDLARAPGTFASFFGPDPVGLLGVVILTSLGTWGLPQMVQKFYAIKDEGAINKGAAISTLFALVVAGGCYFLGGFGRLFAARLDPTGTGIPEEGYDAVIPAMLVGLPDALIAVVTILVLSASMSTLSSLVMASSSTLTLDVLKGHVFRDMDERRQLLVMRVLIAIFIAVSVILALIQHSSSVTFIAQLMGVSWGALAGAFLAPFLYGLYWKRTTSAACWASFSLSTVVMIANILIRPQFPELLRSPINAGAFCMLAGLVVVPVVSLVTPAPPRSLVDDAFSCYDKTVSVRQSEALGDVQP
ncbi:MAG: sodium:solute symporter [Synergistaceae bacterium]|nr:sodium:solute symporter [Synergistaceae bacterium]